MGITTVIMLLLFAAILFIARRFGKIQEEVIRLIVDIATITAAIAAVLVFIIPTPPPAPTSTSAPTSTPTPTPTSTSTSAPKDSLIRTPTTIPVGKLIREISFTDSQKDYCGGDQSQKGKYWGYDATYERFYIIPDSNGYLVVCLTETTMKPEGSIEIGVEASEDLNNFGYGIFFGWDQETHSRCGFTLKTDGVKTIAYFIEGQSNSRKNSSEVTLFDTLNGEHTIRMVVNQNRNVIGYFDGKYIADYKFESCKVGSMGFVAYGTGTKNIYFDNLILTQNP